MINTGIAVGALVGAGTVATHGPLSVAAVGATICLLALPVALATRRLAARPEPPGPGISPRPHRVVASPGTDSSPIPRER